MSRTNIEIDDELMQKVLATYGLASMREAVDFALRELVEPELAGIRELRGTGWEGDLDTLRGKTRR